MNDCVYVSHSGHIQVSSEEDTQSATPMNRFSLGSLPSDWLLLNTGRPIGLEAVIRTEGGGGLTVIWLPFISNEVIVQ